MPRWITPFVKQWFVALGPAINMAGATLLLAYPSGMVLQLKRPDSEITIDTSDESWIAAAPAISALLGIMLTAVSISQYGRWMTQIVSIVTLIIGWLFIDLANDVTVILIGRTIQGLALGSSLYLGPILSAEYVSPKYRGSLMMFTGLLAALDVLFIQAIGLFVDWRSTAVICTAVALANLPIAICSPESPSWLASKQRYEDCIRTFRWLRGNDDEEELAKMIKASEMAHESNVKNTESKSIRKQLTDLKMIVKEKAFYKPIFLMIHVYLSGQWSGSNLFSPYVFDLLENIVGKGYNNHVMDLNINRVLGAIAAIYLISKTKRRTIYFVFSGANATIIFLTAVYTYTKSKGLLPFDNPVMGLALLHLNMFFITTCTLPVPYVIAGEIFPLKYKSLAGGFSLVLASTNAFIYVKTFPYLLNSIGIYGAYTLYAVIISYSLVIAYFYLPETKGKTLQQIEEELTGKPINLDESESVQPLVNKSEGFGIKT